MTCKPGWAGKRPDTAELNTKLRQRAKDMRANPTPAERRLWQHLRGKRRLGYKFRRQHVIDRFIVDFYCAEARMVIELDGEVHRFIEERDRVRQDCLEDLGLRVLRFTNDEVLHSPEGVIFGYRAGVNGVRLTEPHSNGLCGFCSK